MNVTIRHSLVLAAAGLATMALPATAQNRGAGDAGGRGGGPGAAQQQPAVIPVAVVSADNTVRAERLIVQPATLISAGYDWRINGDGNRNASVRVAYRKQGATAWSTGLPPFRTGGERVVSWSVDFTAANAFAGSLFDLEPNTAYQVRLTLSDPDGVAGAAETEFTVRTRAEPMPSATGRTFHVYPFGYTGERQQPAFTGLLEAYYTGAVGGDWYNAFPPRVRPGDVILVHAGVYKDDRSRYGHELVSGYTECCTATGDGTFYLTQSGTVDAPIVIKAAGDGEVIFDGDGNNLLFNVQAANYTYFEGLVFRNTEIAIDAGRKRIAGAAGLTVKKSRFENVNIGIHSDYAGANHYYIVDNIFIGRHNPTVLTHWGGRGAWAQAPDPRENSKLKSQYAVKFYGSGHVVAYNRVENFHDGIDHATYGMPEGYPDIDAARAPVSSDIYNNDVSNAHDNCIEADGGISNLRVFRNRCTNTAAGAFSTQPALGGPIWFVRNVVYHSPEAGAMTLPNNAAGVVFYNNTFVASIAQNAAASNVQLRNNLVVPTGPMRAALTMRSYNSYSSSDYNGYWLPTPREKPFVWAAPADGVQSSYDPRALVERSGATLAEFAKASGQERSGRQLDANPFANLTLPDAANIYRVYPRDGASYALARGSKALDAGMVLPNITDGFAGRAPDLGAVEFGKAEPHYGPR